MERRAFIASVAGLAAGSAAAAAAAMPDLGVMPAGQKSSVLVRSYLTGLTSDAVWNTATLESGNRLCLARAPERRFDPHSIEARSDTGELLGYLPGMHARILAPLLAHGLDLEARIVTLRHTPRRAMYFDVFLSS